MPFHFEIADVLYVEPIAFEPHAIAPTILDRRIPLTTLETWIPRFLARLDATKEGLERLVEFAQGLLARGII